MRVGEFYLIRFYILPLRWWQYEHLGKILLDAICIEPVEYANGDIESKDKTDKYEKYKSKNLTLFYGVRFCSFIRFFNASVSFSCKDLSNRNLRSLLSPSVK